MLLCGDANGQAMMSQEPQQMMNGQQMYGQQQGVQFPMSGSGIVPAAGDCSHCKPSPWKPDHMGTMLMGPLGFVFGVLFYVAFCRKEDDDESDSD